MMQEFGVIVHHYGTVAPDTEISQIPLNELADHLASETHAPAVRPARLPFDSHSTWFTRQT